MNNNRSRTFFIETAMLTLFLLVALSVLVMSYGRAREMGTQAARTASAALILQNADADFQAGAEAFAAAAPGDELALYYNPDGTQNPGGIYCVKAAVSQNGSLLSVDFTVLHTEAPDKALAVLHTARYRGKGAAK